MYGKYDCFVMQMYVLSCLHPVAVLNAAFCMTFSLLMLVEDGRGIFQSRSHDYLTPGPFVYPILVLCVLYVSFGYKVRPITLGALPWVVQCCLFRGPDCSYILQGLEWTECRLFLAGFSVRLFYFVQTKTVCRYGCMHFWLHSCLCV